MIKAILFDVDGVLLSGKYKYFSDRLSDVHNIPIEKITPFFQNELKPCSIGKADLKEEVKKYFEEWGWTGTSEEFLDFWFSGENDVNQELIGFIQSIRESGIKCYISTNQEKYRAAFIRERLDEKNNFDGMFVSCEIGFSKKEAKFFEEILKKIPGISPEDILLVDNDEKVLAAAKEVGIGAKEFAGVDDLKNAIDEIQDL